jgi:hypothetical protein
MPRSKLCLLAGEIEAECQRLELQERGYRVSADDHPMAEGGAPVFHLYAHQP